MNSNGDIPVITAPDYLTVIFCIGERHRKISLEEDGVDFNGDWVSCYCGGYSLGEPYEILESNINKALDDMLKNI